MAKAPLFTNDESNNNPKYQKKTDSHSTTYDKFHSFVLYHGRFDSRSFVIIGKVLLDELEFRQLYLRKLCFIVLGGALALEGNRKLMLAAWNTMGEIGIRFTLIIAYQKPKDRIEIFEHKHNMRVACCKFE